MAALGRIQKLVKAAGRWIDPELAADVRLGRYARDWILPRGTGVDENFVPLHEIGHEGFHLHEDEQFARIQRWRDEPYQALFRQLRADPEINTGLDGRKFENEILHNGYYPTPDAEIYAAMLLDLKPAQIVEVGSGFSTLIARRAIEYGGLNSRITVIDPEPRTNVSAAADEIITAYVEDTRLQDREWPQGGVLFIDSSHVCRSRGDLPTLFCRVLPRLPPGVVVHVHDIFIPYDYPTNYDKLCYTEQYLLFCLLSGATRYHTMLATHNLSRRYPEMMQATFGHSVGQNPFFSGTSYWLEIRT